MEVTTCPIFLGTIECGQRLRGRWGFGESPQQTSLFQYDLVTATRTTTLENNKNKFPVDGWYEGYFELKTNGERREIKERISLNFDSKVTPVRRRDNQNGSVQGSLMLNITGEGCNRFGRFFMTGTCGLDGSQLRIKRNYVHVATQRRKEVIPKTRAAKTAGVSNGDDAGEKLAMIFDRARDKCPKVSIVDTKTAKMLVQELVSSQQENQTHFVHSNTAVTMESELAYDRHTATFIEAFDNGNYPKLWKIAERAINEAIEIAIQEKKYHHQTQSQIVRLVLNEREDAPLAQGRYQSTDISSHPSMPANQHTNARKRRRCVEQQKLGPLGILSPQDFFTANNKLHIARALSGGIIDTARLRGEIEPTNPGPYHINTVANGFGHMSVMGLDNLISEGTRLAGTGARAVILDARVRPGSCTEEYCDQLAALAQMYDICPAARGWRFGPGGATLAGGEDRRHYLILGFEGGITPTHCDFGVQTVLYHTLTGCNRVLAVPREIAVVLHALRESLVDNGLGMSEHCDATLLELESNTLSRCLNAELLEYDEFYAGETMLILPRGGHAVLTGPQDKVVLAGEWHLLPDSRAATAVAPIVRTHQPKSKSGRSAGRPLSTPPAPKTALPTSPRLQKRPQSHDQIYNLQKNVLPLTSNNMSDHENKFRRRLIATDMTLNFDLFDDCDIVELRSTSASAILLTTRLLKKNVQLRVHLRANWDEPNPDRWIDVKTWDRVALETDLALARDAGAAVCVVGNLIRRTLQRGSSHVMLDEEQLARHVDMLKPKAHLALSAPAFDAVSGFLSNGPHTPDRAKVAILRLSNLGLIAAYTEHVPEHLFESLT